MPDTTTLFSVLRTQTVEIDLEKAVEIKEKMEVQHVIDTGGLRVFYGFVSSHGNVYLIFGATGPALLLPAI